MHEHVCVLVTQSCLTLCNLMEYLSILLSNPLSGPPSMGFPGQEYWSELPFPSAEALPDPGIEPGSPVLQADSLQFEPPGSRVLKLPIFFRCKVTP